MRLLKKIRLYNRWHLNKWHGFLHWVGLGIFISFSLLIVGLEFNLTVNSMVLKIGLPRVHAQDAICNVMEYGATGNGVNDETEYIQEAINDCHDLGGGTVYFPPGTYLGMEIEILDNVILELEEGATIQGSNPPSHNGHLIECYNADNVGIMGPGKVDRGPTSGDLWVHLVDFNRCNEVEVSDLEINSEDYPGEHGYGLQISDGRNVYINNVTIRTNINTSSNDAFQVKGGRNININNVDIVSGDDTLVFHGENDLSDFSITNTTIAGYHVQGAFMLTTLQNSNSNLTFDNIVINHAHSEYSWGHGISISPRGPNVQYDDITFSNITMNGNIPKPFHAIYPYCYTNPSYDCDLSGLDARYITFRNITINRDGSTPEDETSRIQNMSDVIFEDIIYNYSAGKDIPNPLIEFRDIGGLCINNFQINQPGFAGDPYSYIDIASCSGVTIGQSCSGIDCEQWQDQACGGDNCSSSQMYQVRTCTDQSGGDFTEDRCIDHVNCGGGNDCSCDNWVDDDCAGDTCTENQMYQTRSCNPSGCNSESQCITDSSCYPACADQNGADCEPDHEYCTADYLMSSDSDTCCPSGNCEEKTADLNCEGRGRVDMFDFGVMMSWWGRDQLGQPIWDYNQYSATDFYQECEMILNDPGHSHIPDLHDDNEVEFQDLTILLSQWGR